MSITFTQVSRIEFDETTFAELFDKELKEAAKSVAIPYKTKTEKEEFVDIIWNLVVDEIGDEYDMDDNDDNDGEELSDLTAAFAIRDTVWSVIKDYTDKVAKEKADEAEAKKELSSLAAEARGDIMGSLSEEDETDGWETVYNGNGTRRMYKNQPGTFYQTYGNGGGKNGWGGYWVPEDDDAYRVWAVAGQEFTCLDGCHPDFDTQDVLTGRIPRIRIVPLTDAEKEAFRQQQLYEQERQRLLTEMGQLKRKTRLERQRE
jgi:hypothetical protein